MALVSVVSKRPALKEKKVPWLLRHPALITLPSCQAIALAPRETTL